MKVAIIIPCYNEGLTIRKVIADSRSSLPAAKIYVFDNNSNDRTRQEAEKAGAIVIQSPIQGKGHVIRQAFKMVTADYYVMLDGDDTYPAEMIPQMLEFTQKNNFDMLIGTRLKNYSDTAFRNAHYFGNQFFSKFVSFVFKSNVNDIFSGFRVFNYNFVKQVFLKGGGFEIETDLTLQAISLGWSIGEMPIHYRHRPEGSFSKLRTFKDGFLILKFIFNVIRNYKPLPFFVILSGFAFIFSIIMGWAPITDYIQYAYVYTVPRAVLAASLMILSAVFLCVGLILDSQLRYFQNQSHWFRALHQNSDNQEQKKSA